MNLQAESENSCQPYEQIDCSYTCYYLYFRQG